MNEEQVAQFNENTLYSETSDANTPDGTVATPEQEAVNTVEAGYDILDKEAEAFAESLMELKKSCPPEAWKKFVEEATRFLKENPDEEIAKGFGMDGESLFAEEPAQAAPAAPEAPGSLGRI